MNFQASGAFSISNTQLKSHLLHEAISASLDRVRGGILPL